MRFELRRMANFRFSLMFLPDSVTSLGSASKNNWLGHRFLYFFVNKLFKNARWLSSQLKRRIYA